jgi:hypothetical protein
MPMPPKLIRVFRPSLLLLSPRRHPSSSLLFAMPLPLSFLFVPPVPSTFCPPCPPCPPSPFSLFFSLAPLSHSAPRAQHSQQHRGSTEVKKPEEELGFFEKLRLKANAIFGGAYFFFFVLFSNPGFGILQISYLVGDMDAQVSSPLLSSLPPFPSSSSSLVFPSSYQGSKNQGSTWTPK